MKLSYCKTRRLIAITFFGILLSACGTSAYYAAAYAPQVLRAGIGAGIGYYNQLEDADISSSISPGEEGNIQKINKIGVVMAKPQNMQFGQFGMHAGYKAMAETVAASIATELQKEGFDVIDPGEIEHYLYSKKVKMKSDKDSEENYYTKNDLIDGALKLKADAVVVGNVAFGSEMKAGGTLGAFTGTTVKSVENIKSTIARVMSPKGQTMMTINVTYKNGQPAQEAGKALGLVTAIKIANPDADVKAEVKARGAKG